MLLNQVRSSGGQDVYSLLNRTAERLVTAEAGMHHGLRTRNDRGALHFCCRYSGVTPSCVENNLLNRLSRWVAPSTSMRQREPGTPTLCGGGASVALPVRRLRSLLAMLAGVLAASAEGGGGLIPRDSAMTSGAGGQCRGPKGVFLVRVTHAVTGEGERERANDEGKGNRTCTPCTPGHPRQGWGCRTWSLLR